MSAIGDNIQALRIKNNLSQEAFAEAIGVSRQAVSKWELGQASPDVDKIVNICKLFSVSSDELLTIRRDSYLKPNKNLLHLGSVYLVVRDFKKSIDFYEKFLTMRVSSVNPDKFAEFYFDRQNISIMNEKKFYGKDYVRKDESDPKFVLNFWVDGELQTEYERVKSLHIGRVTEIMKAHTMYWFFNLYDPDGNVIEITGRYDEE